MRVVRFSPQADAGLGSDPLYGILEDDNQISIISGDPIYHGIQKTAAKVELTKVRLLAPVIPRSKIVAVGKNYADHAKEMGSEVPKEPIIFLKPNTRSIINKLSKRLNMKYQSQRVSCNRFKISKVVRCMRSFTRIYLPENSFQVINLQSKTTPKAR